jgi:hypothetical protein
MAACLTTVRSLPYSLQLCLVTLVYGRSRETLVTCHRGCRVPGAR